MTTETTTPPLAAAPRFAPGDPRPRFARAVELAGDVIAAVPAGRLGDPTPCPELDVRALLGHLVTVLDRVAALGRGDDPFGRAPAAGVADDGWVQPWFDAAAGVAAAWWDDEALSRTMTLPWATLPGRAMLSMYLGEITVHTWDLAVATGQRPAWDDEVVAAALDAYRRALPDAKRQATLRAAIAAMPERFRANPPPFADAVAVAPAAPLIDQLVAWSGRDPAAARA